MDSFSSNIANIPLRDFLIKPIAPIVENTPILMFENEMPGQPWDWDMYAFALAPK
jgi:hypothetical protein